MTVLSNNHSIYFKFEKFSYDYSKTFQQNLYINNLNNFVDHPNHRSSQVVESMFCTEQADVSSFSNLQAVDIDYPTAHYIISTAVFYSPHDWATQDNSLFELLNPIYLKDLKKGLAILLIDQSVEGYQTEWLWAWFHKKCNDYEINPQAIVYLTGNQLGQEQYTQWHENYAGTLPQIKVLPSTALNLYIYQTYCREHLDICFNNILTHKQENLKNIKLYDCTNLRARPQRIVNFLHLTQYNLVTDGKISIGDKNSWPAFTWQELKSYKLSNDIIDTAVAPLVINHSKKGDTQYHVYITRILTEVYKDTWVSLVTESSYFKNEHSIFISEKTFKPIACMQPFIIVGSKHTLKYLRKLGYKTFDGFIDESYDHCDDQDRFTAIIRTLEKIKQIKDKISWLNSMREILEHNHKLFLSIGTTKSFEHQEITKYYHTYFQNIK